LALTTLAGGRWISVTFAAYVLVGLVGVAVRMAVQLSAMAVGLGGATVLAFQASVVSNYWLNNRFTFATRRRSGRDLVTGLALFQVVSLHGWCVQAGVQSVLADGPAAGVVPAGHVGMAIVLAASFAAATIGNYALNRTITWRLPSSAR
jgi:putative flippase GtrA